MVYLLPFYGSSSDKGKLHRRFNEPINSCNRIWQRNRLFRAASMPSDKKKMRILPRRDTPSNANIYEAS